MVEEDGEGVDATGGLDRCGFEASGIRCDAVAFVFDIGA